MLFFVTTILCGDEKCDDEMQNVLTGDQSIKGIAALFIDFSNFVRKNKDLYINLNTATKAIDRFCQLIREDTQENTLKRLFYTTLHGKIINDYNYDKQVRWRQYVNIRDNLVMLKKKNPTFVASVYNQTDSNNVFLRYPYAKYIKNKFLYNLIEASQYFIEKLCIGSTNDKYKQYKENSEILYDRIQDLKCMQFVTCVMYTIGQSDIDHLRRRQGRS